MRVGSYARWYGAWNEMFQATEGASEYHHPPPEPNPISGIPRVKIELPKRKKRRGFRRA
jgi:hypothetical protein